MEVRAWYLVRSALADALGKLLGELHERKGPFAGDLEHLDNRFDLLLEGSDAVIDADFLDNPRTLKLLPKLRRTLEGWLSTKVGLSEGEARSLATRLESYLAPALRDESRAHREYYKPITDHFQDRFAYAAQMEWDWERNRLELIRQMDQPVFEETFSLRQIYVPLRGYFREGVESDDALREERKRRCVVVMLHEEIDRWLASATRERDDVRLITGGPGSGKSTFAKWLAAELSSTQRLRILFFPLQRFRISSNLKDAIANYLKITNRFQQSPITQESFASPEYPLLLIFDGLDELTKPGDLADEQTRLFIDELRHNLGLWNESDVKVLALITSRTVYAQAKRPLLRIFDRQEIAVLPYLIDQRKDEELRRHDELDGEDLLDEDQRDQWWRKYGSAKGLGDVALPEIFRSNSDLCELTAEPLLNYLVVLSGFHGNIATGTEVNRNRVYARLLKDVLDRRHAKRSKADRVALGAVQDVEERAKFERLLETVAVAAWYGDGRTTTRAEIEMLLSSDLEPTWRELLAGGPGFTRLIAAFYIRQAEGSAQTDAIEFTHKSFGEYLTARRLVREVEEIHESLRQGRRYGVDDALTDWARLTGAQAMTMDLLRFIRDEIALRQQHDIADWQQTLTRLFNRELAEGFPLAALGGDRFRAVEARSRNAEEALLASLNACARTTKKISRPDWMHTTASRDDIIALARLSNNPLISSGLISRLRGQRWPPELSVTVQSLSWLELIGHNLVLSDLYQSALTASDLAHAHLQKAELGGADLSAANLTRANLIRADLSWADLSGADLSGANLSGADLSGADLHEADLRGAENLTKEQIESARDITRAKLPHHLARGRNKRRPARAAPTP